MILISGAQILQLMGTQLIQLLINSIGFRFGSTLWLIFPLKVLVAIRNIFRKPTISLDYSIIKEANVLPNSIPHTGSFFSSEILFVVTEKDFLTLPIAIHYARSSLNSNNETPVTLIVPSKSLSKAIELISKENLKNVFTINEMDFIDAESQLILRNKFAERYGWVLQQLLKINFVMQSKRDFVLICDADTILLHPRPWNNSQSVSILFPSYERNESYYNFLYSSFGFGLKPEYSFVSHHMLYSKTIFLEAAEKFGLREFRNLVDVCVLNSTDGVLSPLSLDYEFYGQYLFEFHRESLVLLKWSNLSLPAKYFQLFRSYKAVRKLLAIFFNSVSFHSWS